MIWNYYLRLEDNNIREFLEQPDDRLTQIEIEKWVINNSLEKLILH